MALVRPILEYGAACWDPYREGQIRPLDRVQKKAAKFAHHKNILNWENLASRRKLSCVRGLLEKYPTFGREKETGLLGALDT